MTIITILWRGKLFGLLMLFISLLPNSAVASDYKTGREAAVAGNYEEAISIWEELVLEGNVLATYSLAQIYQNGLGVLKDYEKARTLFHIAALLEYPDAQFALGQHYFSLLGATGSMSGGSGESTTRRDIIKGYTWLSIAAKNGHAEAPKLLNQIEGLVSAELVIEAQRSAKNCEDYLIKC